MPGLSLNTCEEVEKILGKKTVFYSEGGNHSIGSDADKVRDLRTGRSLLTSDEIRTMKDNRAIFIHGNKKPILLKIKPYYKRRNLIKKTKIKSFNNQFQRNIENLKYLNL